MNVAMSGGSPSKASLISEPFDIIVFGGSGDLSRRKLMPALYNLDLENRLPGEGRIIAVSRAPQTDESFVAMVEKACFTDAKLRRDETVWPRFAKRLHYCALDANEASTYSGLAHLLKGAEGRTRVFYLATAPDLFGSITTHLAGASLVTAATRLVLEKPLGHDLASSQAINAAVGRVFDESQIYRIDHYLGKEAVQNLMALRFANALFEPLWNRTFIDHVQITVAETVGVGGRWSYYDHSGALRDMVQNHMLQLLCLVAMEPPISLEAHAVRDEKLKGLRSLAPVSGAETAQLTVRGQYRAGAIGGQPVPGYLDEPDANKSSDTETFVAIKTGIDNWRWSGVPFYLRTGKRLAERCSEIAVEFTRPPHLLYPRTAGSIEPNRLVIRVQPNEGVRLLLLNKEPGPGDLKLRQTALNLSFAEEFGTHIPDAYERLLLDVIRGRPTLFMSRAELEEAWRWTDGIIGGWAEYPHPVRPYTAGGWGPAAALALIERDGRSWRDELS
jgi:glucose-6-phosphate 1-dehydrogenase